MSHRQQIKIEISREDIHSPVASTLILDLNSELSSRYPEEGANHFRLDADEVEEGKGAFLVTHVDGKPVGCGAIRRLDANTAEIKRMYVVPDARGKGIGRAILTALETESRRLNVHKIVLETGDRQPEALALYASSGFDRINRYGEYIDSPLSVCMAKILSS